MSFDEIVADVMNRLNLTSTDALTRIGTRVNDRYRRIASSVNLITARRATKTVTIDPTLTPSLPDLVVDEMEKVLRVILTTDGTNRRVLEELDYDDVTKFTISARLPQYWATKRMGANSVIITFDSTPGTDPFTLILEGYDIADVLADDAEPNFPADFHDILIEGSMSDELRKMEKPDLATIAEGNYERRLSDLRMFIAKTGYMDIYAGKNKPSYWYRPWFTRTTMWG